jgi:hypothetical protein
MVTIAAAPAKMPMLTGNLLILGKFMVRILPAKYGLDLTPNSLDIIINDIHNEPVLEESKGRRDAGPSALRGC